jgi:hypothetical protein
MTSEEERLARLRRTLHSLATLVPKIILTRVEWRSPVLKNKAVSSCFETWIYIRSIYVVTFLLVIILYVYIYMAGYPIKHVLF